VSMKFVLWSSIPGIGFGVLFYSVAYWIAVWFVELVVKIIRRGKK